MLDCLNQMELFELSFKWDLGPKIMFRIKGVMFHVNKNLFCSHLIQRYLIRKSPLILFPMFQLFHMIEIFVLFLIITR